MATNKTFTLKPSAVDRKWVILDAAEAPLGRMATLAASHLMGKYKPTYTAHIDNGDFVVVINAGKLVTTGNKTATKTYYRYSGFPGGMKSASLEEVMAKNPNRAVEQAIRGMLPKNKLLDDRMKRLKVYAGDTHNHSAQQPVKIGVN